MTAVRSLKDKTGSGTIFTVEWQLGTDLLLGTCFCGATHQSEDPIELWDWLTAHPVGHDGPGAEEPSPERSGSPVLVGQT